MRKKTTLVKQIEYADEQKKVNPLDLSSDQDLTVALINLIAIEDFVPDSQIAQMIHQIRVKLMQPIVDKAVIDGDVWQVLEKILSSVGALIHIGNQALQRGDKAAAYRAYDDAYEAYAMFWGLVVFGVDVVGADKV